MIMLIFKTVFLFQMKFLLLVICIAFGPVITKCSHCVTIRNKTYIKEILTRKFNSPYQLSIDHVTDTLFFSFTENETMILQNRAMPFQLAYLNLISNSSGHIGKVVGGFASAVDNKKHKVYLGGEDGIYALDPVSYRTKNLNVIDANIWQIFYRDGLYFTTFPDMKVFLYKDNAIAELLNFDNNSKVKMIALEKTGDIVFCNSSGLYAYNKIMNMSFLLGSYAATGFTSDVQDNLYFSAGNRLFEIHSNEYYNSSKISEVVKLEDLQGVAVEANGNFIYANKNSIIRLKYTKTGCSKKNIEFNKTKTTKPTSQPTVVKTL